MEADPELLDRLETLRNRPVLLARTTVITAIEKDAELALKYLERKVKGEFSPRQETDNKHSGTLSISSILSEIQ